MKYLYYPGCSLEGTAREYDIATRALMAAVGVDLLELPDWTCCGASAAEATSQLLSLVLPARNLCIAESMDADADLLVPCSACYLNLLKIGEKTRRQPDLLSRINQVLAADGRQLHNTLRVRHLLDVLVNDLGAGAIEDRRQRPLGHLKIAPYYGCQCLRPYPLFDDPEAPRSMEGLIRATGAEIHPWQMGAKCCGAAHMNTEKEVALQLVGAILKGARGADAIVTVCPMCQMNLEAYQNRVSKDNGQDLHLTILYLPQLLGLALGLAPESLGLNLNLALAPDFQHRLSA